MSTRPPERARYVHIHSGRLCMVQYTSSHTFRMLEHVGVTPSGQNVWEQYMAFDVTDAPELFTSRFKPEASE